MNKLVAYHGEAKIKDRVLAQLRAHAAADEIIQGKYWEDGKGCAVGCTIHSDKHELYEVMLGIPVTLARLEDSIFEHLPNKLAKEWPLRFMSAIHPGADLSRIPWRFIAALLGPPWSYPVSSALEFIRWRLFYAAADLSAGLDPSISENVDAQLEAVWLADGHTLEHTALRGVLRAIRDELAGDRGCSEAWLRDAASILSNHGIVGWERAADLLCVCLEQAT